MWQRVGQCEAWRCGERLWHAGLSQDGSKCFVGEFDDVTFIVWDIEKSEVIWKDESLEGESNIECLADWKNTDGWIQIKDDSAAGQYQLFGLEHNHAKTKSIVRNEKLVVDADSSKLFVQRCSTGEDICGLNYEADSGDWALASFSDNDRTIAVLEPYYVTFFQQPQ